MKGNNVVIFQGQDIESIVNKVFAVLRPAFSKRQTCIVKPNLCALKKANTGATTHPELVRALVNRLRDDFTEVLIVESDSSGIDAEMKFKFCGYEEVAKTTGAKLVNLTKADCNRVRLEHAKLTIDLPKILFDCDYIVSVPTLKTHCLTVFTSNIKNAYGFIPYPHKTAFHMKVNEVVADLHTIIQSKPTLCIVDGIVAMDGNGPNIGTPVDFGTVIGGEDPLIVDTICCHAMGINPYRVRHLGLSAKYEGRKIPEISEIRIIGKRLGSIKRNFKPAPEKQPFHGWLKDTLVGLHPVNYILDRTLLPIIKYFRKKKLARDVKIEVNHETEGDENV